MSTKFDIDVERLVETNPRVDIRQLEESMRLHDELVRLGYQPRGFRLDIHRRPFLGSGASRRFRRQEHPQHREPV